MSELRNKKPRHRSTAASRYFIGIDLGTGSCKSVIVDEQGQVRGLGVASYPGKNARKKWQMQDPRALMKGVVLSLRRARAQCPSAAGNYVALSVGGALHSLLALDAKGEPLTNVSTWADGRAAGQAEAVRADGRAEQLYEQTGCPVHGMYPLYKLLRLQQEQPQIFDQAARFVSAKEYVVAQLTGEYVVDYCLAAGSGLLNTHTLTWNADSLSLAGIGVEQLARLAPPTELLPQLRSSLARELSLPDGIALVLGSADATNSSLGAGAIDARRATCMVGTSGALRVIAPEPSLDLQARSWCYAVDNAHWLVGGAINNGGIALAWFRDLLNRYFPETMHLSFDQLLRAAADTDPGTNPLICLPFFAGERSPHWNENARAALFGLTLEHTADDLARSLLEGVCFRFRSVMQMLGDVGLDPQQLRASGGFTRSTFWLQLMATILRRELTVPAFGETSAIGAAFWAMAATGDRDVYEVADTYVTIDKIFQPDPDLSAFYDDLYALYQELYQAMSASADKLVAVPQRAKRERGKKTR